MKKSRNQSLNNFRKLNKRGRDRQRLVERLLHIVGGTAVSIVVGAVLWWVIYETIIIEGEVLGGSIFLAFVVGLILFTLLAIYRDSLAKASGKRPLANANVLVRETHRISPARILQSIDAERDGKDDRIARRRETGCEENG